MAMSDDQGASLISVDWGTTALRSYLLASDGTILDRRFSQQGLMSVGKAEFAAVLRSHCIDWLQEFGALPALLSGMVGSRQGWQEVPYVSCPVGLTALARHVSALDVRGFLSVHIVPGVDVIDDMGVADVMRGEECQIMGALSRMGLTEGAFILPGSHSKWATVEAGHITSFQTFMTGEIFAALKNHTILGRMMGETTPTDTGADSEAFARGVDTASRSVAPGAWLHRLFSVRTLGLMGKLPDKDASDYLSGLMLGWEIAGRSPGAGEPLILIGGQELTKRYRRAAKLRGIATAEAPEDCVCAGHLQIAHAAGILPRIPG